MPDDVRHNDVIRLVINKQTLLYSLRPRYLLFNEECTARIGLFVDYRKMTTGEYFPILSA